MASMERRIFIPEAWQKAILDHQRGVFARLVDQAENIRNLNRLRKTLRVLEAAARRIIFVLAMMAPALAPRPKARSDAPPSRPGVIPRPAEPSIRFKLIEPMPMLQSLSALCKVEQPPQMQRVALQSLGLARHYPVSLPEADPSYPALPASVTVWAQVNARLLALKSVATDMDAQVQRLRRWMARQSGLRAMRQFARRSPLLPGRPRALQRADFWHPTKHPKDPRQILLWEVNQLALQADGPP